MTGERTSAHVPQLPAGVLTVMFTDLENSTALWEHDPQAMRRTMAVHDDVVHHVVTTHDGVKFKSTGDGIGAVFASPVIAVDAAIAIQRGLQSVPWPADRPRVRIGLHLGDIRPTRGDYYGVAVNRAARIMEAANGDQIAVSAAVASYLDEGACVSVGLHELRGIGSEDIHLVRVDGLADDDRPLRSQRARSPRRLLPATARSFGRSGEVADIVDLIVAGGFVTLVGAGGVGKTHVALEAARQLQDSYADGAVVVELSSVPDGGDATPQLASIIGARQQPGLDLADSVIDYLSDRELLLVIDNGEHVARANAALFERLAGCPGVAVLATSRVAFGTTTERVFPIGPLPTGDAAQLFVERAEARDSRVILSPEDDAVSRVVAAVDGVPLGVELAAAWVRVLSLEEIATRLEQSIDVAAPPINDSNDRHRTLHDTIEWSYRQLSTHQARLFERLSVFAGGFSISAVEAVCIDDELVDQNDVAPLLRGLADASMINADSVGGVPRFTMLRPLQLFAASAMRSRGDASLLLARHAHYVVDAVCSMAEAMVSENEEDAWSFFDRKWPNIRQAFHHLLEGGETAAAVDLLCSLGWPSMMSLRAEPFTWADGLLETLDAGSASSNNERRDAERAALHGLRAIHHYFAVNADSRTDAERGLTLDPLEPHGFAYIALGAVWVKNQHEVHESDGWTTSWLASLSDASPTWSRLWALGMRAFHLCVHDPSSPETQVCVRQLDELATVTGSPSARAIAHWARGMHLASVEGRLADARDEWAAGREAARSLSDLHLVDQLITGLDLHFMADDDDLVGALEKCRRALQDAHEQHYVAGTSHLFGVTGILLSRVGQTDLARALVPVMLANGHVPRRNAIDALGLTDEGTLPVDGQSGAMSSAADAPRSVHDAAALALTGLSAALTSVTPTLDP